MSQIQFSIVIPTYNRRDVLTRAIESCLNQTATNIEIIVVDDASTDKTRLLIEENYLGNVKYMRYGTNTGANFARSVGAISANGKYICFLDSDDTLHPKHVEMVSKKIKTQGDVAGAVTSNTRVINGEVDRVRKVKDGRISSDDILNGCTLNGFSTLTVRNNIIEEFLPLDTILPANQEIDLYIRLAKAGHDLIGIQDSLVDYHTGNGQISEDVDRRIEGKKRVLQKHGDQLTDQYRGKMYYSLGFLYYKNNNMRRATEAFSEASNYNPSVKYKIHYHSARVGKKSFDKLLFIKSQIKKLEK